MKLGSPTLTKLAFLEEAIKFPTGKTPTDGLL